LCTYVSGNTNTYYTHIQNNKKDKENDFWTGFKNTVQKQS